MQNRRGETAKRKLSVVRTRLQGMDKLDVDCSTCSVRGKACGDCVISVLLGPPARGSMELEDEEQQALRALAGSGLLPPLRLVRAEPSLLDDEGDISDWGEPFAL